MTRMIILALLLATTVQAHAQSSAYQAIELRKSAIKYVFGRGALDTVDMQIQESTLAPTGRPDLTEQVMMIRFNGRWPAEDASTFLNARSGSLTPFPFVETVRGTRTSQAGEPEYAVRFEAKESERRWLAEVVSDVDGGEIREVIVRSEPTEKKEPQR